MPFRRRSCPSRSHAEPLHAVATVLLTLAAMLVAVLATAIPAGAATSGEPNPAPGGEGNGAGGGNPTSAVTVAPDPSVPRPAVPKDLPSEIEGPSPYLRQISCDPTAKPGAIALGKLLVATYPGTSYGVGRACGADGIASEHYEGRAVDWMVSVRNPEGAGRAAAFVDWLLAPDAAGNPFANARRLGVMYLIWNDRIWGSYANAAGWRAYSSCASHPDQGWDTSCHRDHVHISLSWAGAMGATSYWTRQVAPTDYGPCRPADLNWAPPRAALNASPCPAYPTVTAPTGAPATLAPLWRFSGAVVGQGSTGPVVRAVQGGLGVTADGDFGPGTATAVSEFRTAQKLSPGTRVDASTWRALLKVANASVPPPAAGGNVVEKPKAQSPTAAPKPTAKPKPKPAPVPPAARPAASSPLTKYKDLVLTPGSKGEAVAALQRALGVSPVSGWYGPATTAAVVAFQKAHGIPPTGNVGPLTWKALGA